MRESIKLAYIGVNGDVEEWRRFGADLHGMQAIMDGDILRLRMDEKVYRFEVNPAGPLGCPYIGFEWDTSEGLDAAIERIRKAGYDIVEDPELADKRQTRRLARFIAPGGMTFELCTQLAVTAQPFISPTGARFLTGEHGMGHLGLYADDVEATGKFLETAMGLRHSDTYVSKDFSMPFFRGTARHHLIAVAPSIFRSASEPANAGLHHVYIEVDQLTTVGRCWDQVEDGAAPIVATLGQHINDPVVSYYCVSPSAFAFEYGWQSLTVDEETWVPLHFRGQNELWGHKLVKR